MTGVLLLDKPVTPPRRYSVSMPGFNQDVGARLRIYVDGVLQDHVVGYDCAAGTIERFVTNEVGSVIVENGEVLTETLRGLVTVEWKD